MYIYEGSSYKITELLQSRLEMVKNKIKTNKNEKIDIKIAVLEDSKNKIQNRLEIENQNLSKREQNFRDIEKYGDINPFDFNDINQHEDKIILNEVLDLAENNQNKYDRTPVSDVIVDRQRDNYPFILNGEFILNDGEPFHVNRFYKTLIN